MTYRSNSLIEFTIYTKAPGTGPLQDDRTRRRRHAQVGRRRVPDGARATPSAAC